MKLLFFVHGNISSKLLVSNQDFMFEMSENTTRNAHNIIQFIPTYHQNKSFHNKNKKQGALRKFLNPEKFMYCHVIYIISLNDPRSI